MQNELALHLTLMPGGSNGTLTFGCYERTKYDGHSEYGTQYEMQFFTSDLPPQLRHHLLHFLNRRGPA